MSYGHGTVTGSLTFRWLPSIGIKWYLFFAMMLVAMVPFLLYYRLSYQSTVNISMENQKDSLKNSSYLVAQKLAANMSTGTLNGTLVQSELKQMASDYSGRILLIDRSFQVIFDTYDVDERRYVVEQRVLNAFASGRSSAEISTDQQYIEVIQPVMSSSGDTAAVFVLVASAQDILTTNREIFEKNVLLLSMLVLILFCAAYIAALLLARPLHGLKNSIEQFRDGQNDEIKVEYGYAELMKMTDALNEIIDRLHAIDESRKEFVSNVSHELKTPITSIRVLADSLTSSSGEVSPELYAEFMQDISEELDRETKIINDLLSLVKVEEATTALNISLVNMNELLEMLLKRLRPIAQQRNIELVLESFRPVEVQVDEVKITLALSNLVDNAVKYNVENGWVHVSLNADHKYFYVKVADSGVGIPEDAMNKIFERFYRVDKARSRETGGTGLGLAITKSIIQLHKGTIRVHSREGEGTTFTVRLPLTAVNVQEGR